jgi:hypothetical protein
VQSHLQVVSPTNAQLGYPCRIDYSALSGGMFSIGDAVCWGVKNNEIPFHVEENAVTNSSS